MKSSLICAGLMLGGAILSHPLSARSADHEAGVPLTPAEAVGAWTMESGGRDYCTVTLSDRKIGAGYSAKADQACGDAFNGQPAAWQSTADGMRLVDASGQQLIAFGRWSNSLFVSHRSSGVDIQLKRGASRAALAADNR